MTDDYIFFIEILKTLIFKQKIFKKSKKGKEKINIILLGMRILIKKASIGRILNELYGMSAYISDIILLKFGIKSILVPSLLDEDFKSLKKFESDFKLFIKFLNLFFLKKKKIINIENYFLYRYQLFINFKGSRHLVGLPVNGQRTSTNAKSPRSLLFHNRLISIIKEYDKKSHKKKNEA